MRRWSLLALAVVLAAAVGGYVGFGERVDARAQDCEDYAVETNDRVNDARTLLYPLDRPDSFEGSADQAAQEMDAILAEQETASPPEGGGNIHDDLIEAMSAAVEGLSGTGNVAPEVQIAFAKSIIYNADVRLLSLIETC